MTQKKSVSYPIGLSLFVSGIFIFRFLYSLANDFFANGDDVLQIYLIGLKAFTTHAHPYFGADLVYNESQIPGSLQGYLVSAMWYLWKIPEAPHILLNILLFLSLGFLAWFLSKRLPDVPKLLIVMYVYLLPWSMCYFTMILNPAYMICGSILFFAAIFEIYPSLKKNILPEWLCFFMMGFSIFWVMQLHMSWVLLGPFTALAFYYLLMTKDPKRILKNLGVFLVGCVITASFLVPTLLKFGLANEQGKSVSGMLEFHPEHAVNIINLLGKYLIYGCYDVARFTGSGTEERVGFLKEFIWAAPFTVYVTIIGLAQAFFLLFSFFRKKGKDPMLRSLANMAVGGFAILFFMSLFSRLDPSAHSHAGILFFPLLVIFSIYAIRSLIKRKWVLRMLYASFGSAIIMYSALAMKNYDTVSLYKKRDVIVRALEQDNYKLVGLRRYKK
ncbi:MAG: hypothetical protein WCH46_05485 [bacterium]